MWFNKAATSTTDLLTMHILNFRLNICPLLINAPKEAKLTQVRGDKQSLIF